jgi:2-(1,2-epoxy-1,2-dihydrophenyl)acetyl-CoA isomerase
MHEAKVGDVTECFSGYVEDSSALWNRGQAREWGIATRVVAAAELSREAEGFAAEIAAGATLALRAAKRLVREGWTAGLETQLERETAGIVESTRTADAREGIAAFVARRAPRFRGS